MVALAFAMSLTAFFATFNDGYPAASSSGLRAPQNSAFNSADKCQFCALCHLLMVPSCRPSTNVGTWTYLSLEWLSPKSTCIQNSP